MVAPHFAGFAIAASLFGSCGIVLNFTVCLTYILNRRLLDASNIFILNISAGDFLYSITALPMLVTSNALGKWSFGEGGCVAYGFLTTFFALGAMMNLAGAAYERYVTMCKLYESGERQFSRRKAAFLCSVLWSYALIWSIAPIFGWSSYKQEGIGTSCSTDWKSRDVKSLSYGIVLIITCFVVPVAVILYCHIEAYKVTRKLGKQAQQNWGSHTRATRETLKAQKKMGEIAVVITVGFVVAWTPYTVASVIGMYDPNLVSDVGASIPAYFAKSSSCYNPFIYLFMYKKLRIGMVRLLCCMKKQVHVSSLGGVTRDPTCQEIPMVVQVNNPS
ncbi:melanopsin-like [Acropora millepora]|uniref:melanopsin-like n=1 Tax=Acropora millepora TaxID=45264 RepID=UPI001CF2D2FC|nr:melanopsin-like [Acropora millepora]